MERIEERNMTRFVLSTFLNLGIGLAAGIVLGIVAAIFMSGHGSSFIALLSVSGSVCAYVTYFTINMYRLYYYYRLSLDINEVCKGDGCETDSFLSAAILGALTLGLYFIYWKYKVAQRLKANSPRYGFKTQVGGKDIIIMDLLTFGIVSTYELTKTMNKIAPVYNEYGLADLGGVE